MYNILTRVFILFLRSKSANDSFLISRKLRFILSSSHKSARSSGDVVQNRARGAKRLSNGGRWGS